MLFHSHSDLRYFSAHMRKPHHFTHPRTEQCADSLHFPHFSSFPEETDVEIPQMHPTNREQAVVVLHCLSGGTIRYSTTSIVPVERPPTVG